MKYLFIMLFLSGCATYRAKEVGEELSVLVDQYRREEISGDELATSVKDISRLIKMRIFVEGE